VLSLMQVMQGMLNGFILMSSYLIYVESVDFTSRDSGIVALHIATVLGHIYGIIIASVL
jgi:hypothetical protein